MSRLAGRRRGDRDVSGRVYEFYLTAGEHRLSLAANEEAFRLASLTLYNPEPVQAYAQAGPSAEQAAATPAYVRTWEAETAPRKSDATLYPSTDRTSPLTTPYDPVKVQMNTIGGSTWAAAGQWIEWDIEVAGGRILYAGAARAAERDARNEVLPPADH